MAIDLKSFYASVECVERGLDPLAVNLVVADESRTEKTICLAVSPALKAYGIPGRARLFEVVQKVNEINALRRTKAPNRCLSGESYVASELAASPGLALSYIVAPPQMAHYMAYSTRIFEIYLKYIAPEDIHAYSIDEVFIDITHYLETERLSARGFAQKIIQDVYETTGITATAGIAPNLYLCKVAMDIVAKHIAPDENGVRIAELDEQSYREQLWSHRPLTDFWRVGKGTVKRLENAGLYTMGDIARCSAGKKTDWYNAGLLYRLFGVNAELLIDHAWGWEPCTIADIKAYVPQSSSINAGQVLKCPYETEKARLVLREMADDLALDLVAKGLVTDQIVLTLDYDVQNLKNDARYRGEIVTDRYGRRAPKSAHGTENIAEYTSSSRLIVQAATALFDRIADKRLFIRRIYITANRVIPTASVQSRESGEQFDLFTEYAALEEERERQKCALEKEKKQQQAMLGIKKRFGKNAVLKGMNLKEGATARERNGQIGGHKA